MFKKLSFIFLLAISIFGVVLGGKYVYDKQAYQLSFSNFNISSEAKGLYIPNVKVFYKLNIDNNLFDFPSGVSIAKSKVLAFFNKNNITDELYLSYSKEDYSVAIKKKSFDSDKFIVFLENQLNINVNKQTQTIKIDSNRFYYFTNNDFFVFSTLEIELNRANQFEKPKGNYHYLIENKLAPKQQFFKHYKNEMYSFYTIKNDTVKGNPISPSIYYNTIPSNFDTLRFYGSDRVQDDIESLMDIEYKGSFFSWIENSVIHLKKDSLEVLIGLKNEFKNLSNILDEQTIVLSKDSLLPPSTFKNNYEIHSFYSNYIWESLIPFNQSVFKYYSDFNNFNVLGNSKSAMNWFITELQLGNTFSNISTNFHHPNKVHQLTISQSELTHQLTSENWIDKAECLVSEVSSLSTVIKGLSSLPLVSTFPIDFENFKIKTFSIEDTLQVLFFNDEKIKSYNVEGEINWTKKIESPLIAFPLEVKKDSVEYIVLFMKNSIDVIDQYNSSLSGFPFLLTSSARKGSVIQNVINFKLLVEIENKIININDKGQTVSDQILSRALKSNIEIGTMNSKPIVSYVDVNDSLFVKNQLGESIFSNNIKLSIKQVSNFISGQKERDDLRIYGFEKPYIMSQLVGTGQKDSLRINQELKPVNSYWTKHNNRIYLIIEEYNRVIIFNEFGLLEKEIQKPKPNLKLISNAFFDDDIVTFFDFINKKLYLLDSYGRRICDYPISGESNFDINNNRIVVSVDSQIYIYSLETN